MLRTQELDKKDTLLDERWFFWLYLCPFRSYQAYQQ